MNNVAADAPAHLEAELNYLQTGAARPVFYADQPPPGMPRYGGATAVQRLPIRDARVDARRGEFSLDRSGFELRKHASLVRDFSDETLIKTVYYPEAEELLKQASGAVKVVIFDHTVRNSADRARGATEREPVMRVHNDQTSDSGPRRVRDHLSPDEAEFRLKHRFAIINLWRPIDHPVETAPLALCDARTVTPQDLVATDLVYPDKVGEVYSFTYNPQHRWYYYPRQQPDEVLLLKIYDSRTDGTARLTAHTAFDDLTAPPDAIPRRSIELRTLVFFAPRDE